MIKVHFTIKTSWANFEVRATTGRRPISVNLRFLGPKLEGYHCY